MSGGPLIPVSQSGALTLHSLARVTNVRTRFLVALVEEGVLTPRGHGPEEWQFDLQCIGKVRLARRLQSDLRVNVAGVALALELLAEIDSLRARLRHHI